MYYHNNFFLRHKYISHELPTVARSLALHLFLFDRSLYTQTLALHDILICKGIFIFIHIEEFSPLTLIPLSFSVSLFLFQWYFFLFLSFNYCLHFSTLVLIPTNMHTLINSKQKIKYQRKSFKSINDHVCLFVFCIVSTISWSIWRRKLIYAFHTHNKTYRE